MPTTTRPPLATPFAESHVLTPAPADVRSGGHGDPTTGEEIPCSDVAELDQLVLAIQTWHDDTHRDPWRFCAEQPCDVTRRITGSRP